MSKSGKIAADFQEELLKKIAPAAKVELKELQAHAKTLGISKINYFDINYVAAKLEKKLYSIDQEVVKSYFPLPHVQEEMFTLFSKLFSISVHQVKQPLWHKDVQFFDFAMGLAEDLAAEVDARDEVITELLDLTAPHVDEFGNRQWWQYKRPEQMHARACEIAGRTE